MSLADWQRNSWLVAHESGSDRFRKKRDRFGVRYAVEFEIVRGTRRAVVRSCWIVRRGETLPRFVTCHVV